jgi:hypothetical protein
LSAGQLYIRLLVIRYYNTTILRYSTKGLRLCDDTVYDTTIVVAEDVVFGIVDLDIPRVWRVVSGRRGKCRRSYHGSPLHAAQVVEYTTILQYGYYEKSPPLRWWGSHRYATTMVVAEEEVFGMVDLEIPVSGGWFWKRGKCRS